MATTGIDGDGIAADINGLLGTEQGSNGFESHTEGDWLAIADTTLDAAAVVGEEKTLGHYGRG